MSAIGYRDSCRGKFKASNVLTLTGLFIYECLLFLFKNREKFAPFEIRHCFNTRSLGYNIPVHRLTGTEKGPTYSAIKFFNSLPYEIRSATDLVIFKSFIFELLVKIEPYTQSEFFGYFM